MLLAHRTEFWPTRLSLESDMTLIEILTSKIILIIKIFYRLLVWLIVNLPSPSTLMVLYTVSHKNATLFSTITLVFLGQFLWFLCHWKQEWIFYNYEGRPVKKLQNGIILLMFKKWEIRNIRIVRYQYTEIYEDDVIIVTSIEHDFRTYNLLS